jgi:hypothetical protein
MTKYTRRTRGRSISQSIIAEARKLKCSIHMLKSDVPMTFAEIVKAHAAYTDGHYHQGPFAFTEAQIQKGLSKLVELGLVEESGTSGRLVRESSAVGSEIESLSTSTKSRTTVRTNVSRLSKGRKTSKTRSNSGRRRKQAS